MFKFPKFIVKRVADKHFPGRQFKLACHEVPASVLQRYPLIKYSNQPLEKALKVWDGGKYTKLFAWQAAMQCVTTLCSISSEPVAECIEDVACAPREIALFILKSCRVHEVAFEDYTWVPDEFRVNL